MWVQSVGQEDPLEEGMATHSSILAWRIPMDRGALWVQFIGSQRVRHDGSDPACRHAVSELSKTPTTGFALLFTTILSGHLSA